MAFRYSADLRNAGLDARIAAVGPNPSLVIYSSPQTAASREPDGELVSFDLPSDWMSKAEDGFVSNLEVWKGRATGEGEAKSFRICDRSGFCHIDGAIPDDMKLDNANIAKGQTVTVSVFVIKSGNGSGP